jgi:probable H4MPT-linked C1 transfer pathway protein
MTSPHSPHDVLALDIGGANIKAADGRGWTHAEPFAMWREAPRLADVLTRIIHDSAAPRVVATMTGEIADCFPDRTAGVMAIVAATHDACAAGGRPPPEIYRVDGRLVPAADAVADPLGVAAANWHALARLAAALVPGERAFLLDVGSTTTDIVPLDRGRPVPLAHDDAARMLAGELVYTGVERTPLPAIVRTLPHAGARRPVASERFAESRDAWLLLGGLAEDARCHDTADGGPATREAARVRIARSMLVEPGALAMEDAARAARHVARAQGRRVARALKRVTMAVGWTPAAVVISGHGGPLARMALEAAGWQPVTISLPGMLGDAVSRCAPAHALALIARGELR